ncbi:manganese efflux pump MntP [Calidifontibacillus erzurumensis]|uniref:Putative manganese efflux pump MntP n=1 Tax=Calidifontibacillus erzurumensis TaxID=2741433 RepID=A0A8J8GEB5_9BACI|nr:manganese efflux pump MntP family protein [Calidifontibacillus erzurumensis]NSL52097.1 manganese efflux pump [Calidifontibacillus erzurumensis]
MGLSEIIGEVIPLAIMAMALGMDAFSLGLGMGMLRLRLKQVFYIGITIGFFHVIMPLLGIVLGRYISYHFSGIATYIGGFLLLILGLQMVISSFKSENDTFVTPIGFGLIVFALTVSLDSFSVGLSLGIFGARTAVTIMLFGFFSMVLTWAGLLLGRKVQTWLGSYGEALGGSILFAFGLKLLLPI